MTSQLGRSLVRVWGRDGKVVGTGFLVSDREFLTCAHVVALALSQALDASPSGEEVLVDFPLLGDEPEPLPAVVTCWWPEEATGRGDIAGLLLKGTPPPDVQPVMLISAEELWDYECRAFGFAGGVPRGDWVSGVLRDSGGTGWLQIDVKQTGRRIQRGFSGGPVWVDDDALRGVVGMVVAADKQDGDRVAYAIPTSLLLRAWPSVVKERTIAACPYRGLLRFREQDAGFFFGRHEEIARLVKYVRRQPLVAVLGPSGSGKSSLVAAGLIPALRSNTRLVMESFQPGFDAFGNLAAALLHLLDPELGEGTRQDESVALARAVRNGRLAAVVDRILDKTGASQLMLVADQFEELYTLCPADERDAFLDMIFYPEMARRRALVVVLTMRADFYARALEHSGFRAALEREHLNLGAMSEQELRKAIEEPARRRSVSFEDGLVDRILDDVGNGPGQLPLLEFALTQLWEQQQYGRLTHNGYRAIGRVEGALTQYANEVYERLSEDEKSRVWRVLGQLVELGEGGEVTSRVAARTEMSAADWNIVQRLADERLVVTDHDPISRKNETAQVAHEALIQGWSMLRDWVAAHRDFLWWRQDIRAAVRMWERSGRDDGGLLRGVRLAEAERWRLERPWAIDNNVLDFIRESRRSEAADLVLRGQNYMHGRMWAEAINCYERARSAYIELEEPEDRLETLRALTSLYFEVGEPGQGMARYRERLQILGLEAKFDETSKTLVQNISMQQEPLTWYRQGLAIHRQVGERHGEAEFSLHIGDYYLRQGAVDRWFRLAYRSARIFQEIGESWKAQRILAELCENHAKRGEPCTAIRRYRELKRLRRGYGWWFQIVDFRDFLIHIGIGILLLALLFGTAFMVVWALYNVLIGEYAILGVTIEAGGRWVIHLVIALGAIAFARFVDGSRVHVLLASTALVAVGEGWLSIVDRSDHAFVLSVLSALLLLWLVTISDKRWAIIRPYTRVLLNAARWVRHQTIDRLISGGSTITVRGVYWNFIR